MRLLCVDHYFDQDIEALRRRPARTGARRRYEPFLELARRFFPDGSSPASRRTSGPSTADARAATRALAQSSVERLHARYRFDALLAPSDTFFWIRALIEACGGSASRLSSCRRRRRSRPAGWRARRGSGASIPFIADHMLVSSEHPSSSGSTAASARASSRSPGSRASTSTRARRAGRCVRARGCRRPVPDLRRERVPAVIDRTGLAPWRRMRGRDRGRAARRRPAEATLECSSRPIRSRPRIRVSTWRARNPAGCRGPGRPRGDVRRYILDADVVVGFRRRCWNPSPRARPPSIPGGRTRWSVTSAT